MSHVSVSTIHAFTDGEAAKGNPAAVCLLDAFPEYDVLQSIAKKMNLSETAFLVRVEGNRYKLRWFTPKVEVPLCGHGTLAAAHYLREHATSKGLMDITKPLEFETQSGMLEARIVGQDIALTLPRAALHETHNPKTLAGCVDVPVVHSFRSDASYVIEVADMETLKKCRPTLAAINKLDAQDLIVTCPGEQGYDYCYRCFCPQLGIDEDPVTGSANCTLAPYWAEKLGRTSMKAFQASAKGGVLGVTLGKDSVEVTGHATTIKNQVISLDSDTHLVRAM